MAFFKEKMYLGQFCRAFSSIIINIKPYDLLSIDAEKKLSKKDCEVINNNLKYFQLVVFMYLLLEKNRKGKIKKNSDEIGYTAGQAINLAYQDNHYSNVDETLILLDIIENYNNHIEKVPEKELNEKGAFFFLCQNFSNIIMPINDYNDDVQTYKYWFAFDVAKQTYGIIRDSFEGYFKKVKILD